MTSPPPSRCIGHSMAITTWRRASPPARRMRAISKTPLTRLPSSAACRRYLARLNRPVPSLSGALESYRREFVESQRLGQKVEELLLIRMIGHVRRRDLGRKHIGRLVEARI